jgi:DNA-binding CsgD family transcriptional regulator
MEKRGRSYFDLGRTVHLNARQLEVLGLLCKGLRNIEIAGQLGLSERSIKAYVGQLFLIFDASNRTELAGMVGSEVDNTSGGPGSAHIPGRPNAA